MFGRESRRAGDLRGRRGRAVGDGRRSNSAEALAAPSSRRVLRPLPSTLDSARSRFLARPLTPQGPRDTARSLRGGADDSRKRSLSNHDLIDRGDT